MGRESGAGGRVEEGDSADIYPMTKPDEVFRLAPGGNDGIGRGGGYHVLRGSQVSGPRDLELQQHPRKSVTPSHQMASTAFS